MGAPLRLAGLALAASTPLAPLLAQDAAPTATELELERTKNETAQILAENEQFKARADGFQAQVDALGLPKPKGETSLEGNAGKLEGWMLASATLNVAATRIDENIGPWLANNAPSETVILLDSDDVLDLKVGEMLRFELDGLTASYGDAMRQTNCTNAPGIRAAAATPVTALIGTALSLLRTDTKISGFSFDTAEGALLNAIAGTTGGRYAIPGDLAAPGAGGATLTRLRDFIKLRGDADVCRAAIETAAGSNADAKKAAAARLVPLLTLAARSQAWLDAVSERKDGKPSRLELAMVADALLVADTARPVLRVRIEKAGGSLLHRSNLFTMLGAPAIGITGGTVISWRLSTPGDGVTRAGGILVCRTKLTNLNAIHAGRVAVGGSSCSDNLTPAAGSTGKPARQTSVAGGGAQ